MERRRKGSRKVGVFRRHVRKHGVPDPVPTQAATSVLSNRWERRKEKYNNNRQASLGWPVGTRANALLAPQVRQRNNTDNIDYTDNAYNIGHTCHTCHKCHKCHIGHIGNTGNSGAYLGRCMRSLRKACRPLDRSGPRQSAVILVPTG